MIRVLMSFSYTLVLLYGSFLAIEFAGGCRDSKKQKIAAAVISLILIVQMVCAFSWGIPVTKRIYPLISHLPLVLFLVIGLKKPVGLSLISVLTAYFCCQLPRWLGNVALFLFHTQTAFLLAYTTAIVVFFFLIKNFFAKPAYRAMTYSKQSLFLFGLLPLFYYLFDYATTVYTDALYQGIKMISEFLPVSMALFYILFIVVYHNEVQQKNQVTLDNTLLSMQLEQAADQIQSAQTSQELSRIYRHDLRHHLALIGGFAESGEIEKIKDYLAQTQSAVDAITAVRFCENETVNLILSAFDVKAKNAGVRLSIEAHIPQELALSDTQLCAVLSNGLENAIAAASLLPDCELRTVRVNCTMNRDKLLILIQNAYTGNIEMENSIPISKQAGHGFGCRSIATIAEKRNGFSLFQAESGIFTLRVVLPMDS